MALTKPYSKDTPSTVTLDDGTVRDVPEQMTLVEFCAFPWPIPSRWELIQETPTLAPKPCPPHQYLADELREFVKAGLKHDPRYYVCREVDILLPAAQSYVEPDVVVVDEGIVDTGSRPMQTVPALVVEVLSTGTASLELGPKRDAYAEAGVPEYWVVDPQSAAVKIHLNPKDGDYQNPPADKDGYVTSPLLGVTFRVSREGNRFKVLTR
jgi:Uma2 family endonuclease